MSMERTKAIVLKRTNYGEADRVLQLLTPDKGKVSVIAKGVRLQKSKLAGSIELFAVSQITYTTGKGDLAMLTGARLERFYSSILSDYDRLQFGYEAIKQISRAADMLDQSAFFELLEQTFQSLDNTSINIKVIKTWFWLQLAILVGSGLNLSTDAAGMNLVEGARYLFDRDESVLRFQENGNVASDHIKLLRVLSAQSPRVVMQVSGVEKLIDECLKVAEQAVAH